MILISLVSCVAPDRTYHIYNIVNGELPGDAKIEATKGNFKLEGLVIYQRFEVKAEAPQDYNQDTTLQGADSLLPK
jgi:hypothetical protein